MWVSVMKATRTSAAAWPLEIKAKVKARGSTTYMTGFKPSLGSSAQYTNMKELQRDPHWKSHPIIHLYSFTELKLIFYTKCGYHG
jgi:hypothetical protein